MDSIIVTGVFIANPLVLVLLALVISSSFSRCRRSRKCRRSSKDNSGSDSISSRYSRRDSSSTCTSRIIHSRSQSRNGFSMLIALLAVTGVGVHAKVLLLVVVLLAEVVS